MTRHLPSRRRCATHADPPSPDTSSSRPVTRSWQPLRGLISYGERCSVWWRDGWLTASHLARAFASTPMLVVNRRTLIPGLLLVLICAQPLRGEPVAVRHVEGVVHGFLVLRTLDGTAIADGDLIQTVRGSRVTTRLTFRFEDGSVHDETAVFTQRGQFRLVSSRLVQKGPTFPQPLELTIDVATGKIDVRYTDEDGEQKTESEQMDLPPDLANGIVMTLLKNIRPDAPPKSFSYVAATPKPRMVKLKISVAGPERFSTGRRSRRAMHYVLAVDIGGISGLLAPLLGKQPPDSHVWILGGEAPAFVKAEQSMYAGGPVWRIELISPVWPKAQ